MPAFPSASAPGGTVRNGCSRTPLPCDGRAMGRTRSSPLPRTRAPSRAGVRAADVESASGSPCSPLRLSMLRLFRHLAMWSVTLSAILLAAAPARADDISAAARGVVRVVTIAVVNDEVVGFGHGSGFAVAPDQIVTNAHVVEAAARYPGNVLVSVVPSEGDKAYQAQLVAVDPAKDLALLQFRGARLPPLTVFTGAMGEGDQTVALGYPGNVDLATARSAADYITPVSPVRSQGVFSGRRSLMGTEVMLHTASIARGNSGGPLLDRCGRVLGVNSALTRGEEGDAPFGFAIAERELLGFLREANQAYAGTAEPCTALEQRLEAARTAEAREASRLAETAAREAAAELARRATALEAARAAAQRERENMMALAALLLAGGTLALAAGGLLLSRGSKRPAYGALGGGGLLIVGAVAAFLLRPSVVEMPDEATALATPSPAATAAAATGPMVCRLMPELSRVTVSATSDVPFTWRRDGCVNARTQYVPVEGDRWRRVLVPEEEQTVSVLEYDPAHRRYTNTRYLLAATEMAAARTAREDVEVKTCTNVPALRANLAKTQDGILATLPALPNERLVYDCTAAN